MITSGLALSAHFGDGTLRPADVAAGIVGAVIKDPVGGPDGLDRVPRSRWSATRPEWTEFYRACRDLA